MARTRIHPGQILADELEELGVSPTELARQLRVPPNRISQIINGKAGDHRRYCAAFGP
jgi:antitoxin HigA-1